MEDTKKNEMWGKVMAPLAGFLAIVLVAFLIILKLLESGVIGTVMAMILICVIVAAVFGGIFMVIKSILDQIRSVINGKVSENTKVAEKAKKLAEQFREEEHTYFVLESLETLRKNGRLSNLKALAADVLNIKPVMGSDPDGNIVQLDKARGMKKALDKMVTQMFKNAGNTEEKVLAISHCNCPERAEWVKELALSKGTFKDCFIVDTRGISSLYANDGGIIMVI